jgi:hypothetical protein
MALASISRSAAAAGLQPQPPPWLTDEMLRPLVEINALALQLVCRRAREPDHSAPAPAMLRDLEGLWTALDDSALQRIAHCPFVLIDGGIIGADVGVEGTGTVRDAVRVAGFFGGAEGGSLARLYATFCWHLARTHRLAARMMLGMSSQYADIVRGFTLRELERFAESQARMLQPRWPERTDVWAGLLTAAIQDDQIAIERARLRGLHLLASANWPA